MTKGTDQYAAAAGTTFDAEGHLEFLATNEAYILDADGKLDWEPEDGRHLPLRGRPLSQLTPPGVAVRPAAANLAFMSGKVAMTLAAACASRCRIFEPEWVRTLDSCRLPSRQQGRLWQHRTFMLPDGDQLAVQAFAEFMLQPDNLAQAIWRSASSLSRRTSQRKESGAHHDPTVQRWSTVLAQMSAVAANATGVAQFFTASPEAGLMRPAGSCPRRCRNLVNNVDPEQAVACYAGAGKALSDQ